MADRPILFSGPMVRALLAGAKTQTRRAIKPRGHASLFDGSWADSYVLDPDNKEWREDELRIKLGDRLYVREHWRTIGMAGTFDSVPPRDFEPQAVWYVADGEAPGNEFAGKFRQGMHMPRWASRLTLTVTDVRVERLNDCTAEDALAEGVSSTSHWRPKEVEGKPFEDKWWDDFTFWSEYPQLAYRELWEAINGPGSWEANPWVAAYSFTVHQVNIDAPA